uniref:RNA binding motif protein 26 n=1 Tax=Oncorhynchus mykiss TaxID=8022 RepID=A0A8K9Y2R0_ONCMY
MIIENLDSLKTWLFKTLEPICDADPSALAKYVVALVKKDKSETELKALCVDQLDVFLQKGDDRKRDDRTRKRNDYDRIPPRRDSYRDRYNRRRGRSYSRSRSRSKDRARDRERDRDRGSRSHSRSHSKSRGERGDRQNNSGSGEGLLPIPTATATFPVPTLSSTITVIAPQGNHSNSIASVTDSWSDFHPDQSLDRPLPPQRKRCRDYDEKGFCMRGDICPFDHGIDPVVVEDVNLPNMFQAPPPIPGVAQPPPGLPPPPGPPPLMTPPPVNLRPPVPLTGSLPPVFYLNLCPAPPGPPHQASGMDAPPSSIANSVPTIVTTGTRPSIPQPPAPLFPPVCCGPSLPGQYDPDMYNPEDPSLTNTSRPVYRHRVNAQRPNLIGLTMGEDLPHRDRDQMPNRMRIVLDSASRKRSAVSHHGAMLPKKPWSDKPNFNQQNLQGGFHNKNPQNQNQKAPFGSNTKLSVLQIPQGLNNISKLNQHFSKFGTIVNLQVTYGNDPEGALIQFDSHEEAKRALQSPEAVLNNRFIRVLWHSTHGKSTSQIWQPIPLKVHLFSTRVQQPATSLKQSVKDRLGPLPADCSEPNQDSRVASQNDFKSNLSMKERLGFASKPGSTPSGPAGKVFSTSTGLTKTVYNMAALKAAQKTALFAGVTATEEAMKNKQEALRLQQEMRKKKQEILEKHIETQKLLICKLEKNKTMKAGDKAVIMTTLGTLTKSITKLQQEIKGLSNPSGVRGAPKSKAQAQKELLDTELDLYKKTQSGEDTVQLKIRYTQLQLEAAKRGILAPGRGRGAHARGRGGLRGRGRGRGCRGRGLPVHSTVDHRPRALEISGFTETDLQDLLPHFAQFGELEDCQIDETSCLAVITYRSRPEAEQAALHSVRLNGSDLRLSWHKPAVSLTSQEPDEQETDHDEVKVECCFSPVVDYNVLLMVGGSVFQDECVCVCVGTALHS